jgi:hippurate hydrolase
VVEIHGPALCQSKITVKGRDGNTVPVGHMCGHDMHVTWLLGAAKLLSQARTTWRGTLMAVFQPGEETLLICIGAPRPT